MNALLCALTLLLADVKSEVVAPAVHIETPRCYGSGTLINFDGELLILTAAHVTESLYAPRINFFRNARGGVEEQADWRPKAADILTSDGRRLKARPVWAAVGWQEDGIDLALLKPEGDLDGLKAALLCPKKPLVPELGEDVLYCGSGGGLLFSLEKSIVNQVTEEGRYITTNGNGWFGHSGSGLYLKREGQWILAGVLTQTAVDPRDDPKTPVMAEAGIADFLRSYAHRKKQQCPCGPECPCGPGECPCCPARRMPRADDEPRCPECPR